MPTSGLELANEAQCFGCDLEIMLNWTKTTSAMIKNLGPLHIISIGNEGYFSNDGGEAPQPGQGPSR